MRAVPPRARLPAPRGPRPEANASDKPMNAKSNSERSAREDAALAGPSSSRPARAGFLGRHGKRILWLLVAWAILTGLVVWLSEGPQNEPFVYQVF